MVFSTDLFLEYKKRPGRAALARLLERHQDAVYTLCRQVLRHPQDAEDACQEILLEVSRQVDAIDEPGKFPGWLYRTALHTALDFKRQRGRRRVRESRAVPAAEPEPAESAEALHQGLAGLDDTSRMLVVEHYFGRRPLRELAAERGCSEVAVWKRIENARERLRKVLGSAAVSALEGIANVPAPAGFLHQALGLAGGLTMAKIAIKVAIVAPLLLLAGAGSYLAVRHPAPTPPPPAEVRKPTPVRPATHAPAPPPISAASAASASPAKPTVVRARKPYPLKDPRIDYPAAAVHAWEVLSKTRITLDCENESLPKLLETVSRLTGLTLTSPTGYESERISFKVQDIVVDGALRLMLQPRNRMYEILPDGTVHVDELDKIKGGYEKVGREASGDLLELDWVREKLNGGWDGVSRTDPGAELEHLLATKRIVSTQGETTLAHELNRLREMEIYVHVEGSRGGVGGGTPRQEPFKEPFLQVVAERSIEEHLQDLARHHGMVSVPYDGMVIITKEENAATYRAKADNARQAYRQQLEILDKTVELSGSTDIPDFLDSVGRSHGVRVIPTEAAWNNPATLSLSPGTTLRQALDQLKGHGLRWAANDGKVYVLK